MIDQLQSFCRCASRTARLMVGIPDYQAYVERHRQLHPDIPEMTYEEFYRETQRRRYTQERGKFRCSCC